MKKEESEILCKVGNSWDKVGKAFALALQAEGPRFEPVCSHNYNPPPVRVSR